ncbi:MAG: CapA family protein [Oscillospiraceae bacterium]|nr:CapA family protein [Oscillospiraceae bacterium]
MLRNLAAVITALILMLTPSGCAAARTGEDEDIPFFQDDGAVISESPSGEPKATFTAEPMEVQPEPQESTGPVEILITAVGDVTLGGNRKDNPASTIYTKEFARQGNDYAFAFRNVRDIFETDDLTIVNFEGTFTTRTAGNGNTFQFRVDPDHVKVLTSSSVEMATFENNHAMDFGQGGLDDTITTLNNAGIPWARAGTPAIRDVNGVKVGMLAYMTLNNPYENVTEQMQADIPALRQLCDVVIVYYHWGEEAEYTPHSRQLTLGRATIDAGADLVLGAHSHRVNPIELYNGRYIVYSLGNFSFSGNSLPSDMDTFIFQLKLIVDGDTVRTGDMRIIPSRISSKTDTNDFAPTPFKEGSTQFNRVISKMISNGKNMLYALTEYPTQWPESNEPQPAQ